MKNLIALIAVLLILSACNNRENMLLPPDLSAADYQAGDTINTYANYLVKSSNDNSYLLIDKTAIQDSLLNYGDEIVFRKVASFASRDSLAIQEDASAKTGTYEYSVLRFGKKVDFISSLPLGKVYTDLSAINADLSLLNFSYYLQASPIQPISYGNGRAFFPLFATGEFAIFALPHMANPEIQHNGTGVLHALLQDDSGNQLSINFPAAYCSAAGTISLSMGESLELSDQTNLQHYFPNAAISTPVINIHTSSATGSETAVLRLNSCGKGYFGKQWMRLSADNAYSWPQTFPDATTANWWQEGSTLYSFVSTTGKYFLLTPLDTQSELSIPLDGSMNQIFLQDLWFNLNNLNLAETSMKLKLTPDVSTLLNNYFSANPYTIAGAHQAFEISFWQGTTPLASLPDDSWLEFGFRTSLAVTANDRLFRVYRSTTEDLLTYKTTSDTYDATHYSRNGSYVYTGISSSATYLYGSITDSAILQTIPWYKTRQYLQTAHSIVSWTDSSKRGYTHLNLDLNPALPSHPWLQSEPLNVTNRKALAGFMFYQDANPVSTLPTGFYLSLPSETEPDNVLLFSSTAYPRLKNYIPATTFTGDSFVLTDYRIGIYPEFPGTLFSAAVTYANPMPLRVYPTMTFVFGDLRLYTYGNAAEGQSAIFNFTRSNALADTYQALVTQYSLIQTSSAYAITTSNETDYALYQPTLFFKRTTRNQNLLFYENTGDFYRLYPYSQSETFDPWYFVIDGAYNGVSIAYNGSYASFTDTELHTGRQITISNASRDAVLSLYQAQLVLPVFFIGQTVPLASTLRLDKLSVLPGTQNLLAAYQLQLNRANGTPLAPDFYTVVGATQMPYVYIPIADTDAIATARMFYRNTLGQTIELNRVQNFGDNFANEFTVTGNSFICTVKNPGIFYVTGQ
ncbi:MAG: hypothetical protein RBS43_09640 [Candidatus Cloacimonas sp.]|jgi:predicted pyridoxine 5'-phosphate oxidase superfamily flavin-nucleotide-binding protein|nr:hypothetical protein [Candidatus Cloacimonas sp.]